MYGIGMTVLMLGLASSGPQDASPMHVKSFMHDTSYTHDMNAKVVVEAMFAAFNRHDAAGMAKLYAKDAWLMSSDFCSPRQGPSDVLRTYQALFTAYPDIHDDVDTYVVEGDHVAVHFTAKSGLKNQPMTLPIATFLLVREGRIVRDESLFDTAGRPCSP